MIASKRPAQASVTDIYLYKMVEQAEALPREGASAPGICLA